VFRCNLTRSRAPSEGTPRRARPHAPLRTRLFRRAPTPAPRRSRVARSTRRRFVADSTRRA